MKKDLIVKKVKEIGLTNDEAKNIVELFFKIIKDELSAGNEVKISGFGKFYVKSRKERKTKSPRTGREVITPARKEASLKFSENFKKFFHDKIGEGNS